ncbi:hypothetical protein CXB51_001942 [Gossypium anomalum]|uniref:Squalene monooxygenase n=1 Tax=Gossypium anomalum TaxID=47600 RepID=A0A8J6DDK0_9ROSI|nr:hypothetical protein CXB51_001942 [Gossypium anomalum]
MQEPILVTILSPSPIIFIPFLTLILTSDCIHEIDAQRVFNYVLYKNGKNTWLFYTLKHFQSDVVGRSFHNGRFIQRMRHKAASLPNVSIEQRTVTSLIEENGTIKGVQYKTKGGRELRAYAPLTIVCDDSFSNLRCSFCYPKVDIPYYFVSLVLENCELPYANIGHVILAYPSPILFYPISSTEIRCLVDVPGQKVPSLSNGEMALYLKTVVAPQIPAELKAAFISTIDKEKTRTMSNRSMHVALHPTLGAILMGGAFDMDLLRPLYDLHDAFALCVYLKSFNTLRKISFKCSTVVSTIKILSSALYKVFSASPDPARKYGKHDLFKWIDISTFRSQPSLDKPRTAFLCGGNIWC